MRHELLEVVSALCSPDSMSQYISRTVSHPDCHSVPAPDGEKRLIRSSRTSNCIFDVTAINIIVDHLNV